MLQLCKCLQCLLAVQSPTHAVCLCSKSSPAAVHLMEDALKWGAEHVFSRQRYISEQPHVTGAEPAHQSRPASAAAAASPLSQSDVKMEEAPSPRSPSHAAQEAAESAASPLRGTPPASASPEPSMKSPFGAPEQQQVQHKPRSKSKPRGKTGSPFQPVYTDSIVEKLVQWSASQPGQNAAAGNDQSATSSQDHTSMNGRVGSGPPSLKGVLGPEWACVKLHEWTQVQFDDETQADEGAV